MALKLLAWWNLWAASTFTLSHTVYIIYSTSWIFYGRQLCPVCSPGLILLHYFCLLLLGCTSVQVKWPDSYTDHLPLHRSPSFILKLFLIEIQVWRQTCVSQAERMVVKPSDPFIKADPRMLCRKISQKLCELPWGKAAFCQPCKWLHCFAWWLLPAIFAVTETAYQSAERAVMIGAVSK